MVVINALAGLRGGDGIMFTEQILKETRNAFDCIIIGSRSKNNYFW